MRALITTWLEVAGLLLLAAAAFVVVCAWSLPGALATTAVVLLAEAWLLEKRS